VEEFIRDVSLERFEAEVIEASRTVPVLVDFWADWCAPCKALKPVLDKLARERQGEFVLAKVDTERERELAARFGIRSIPNVKAFVDGKPVAEFSGALPESAVRAFLAKVLPSPAEKLRLAAQAALAEGEFERAEQRLKEARALDPDQAGIRLDLVELLLARQAWSEAERELGQVPERLRDDRAEQLAARIEFWKKGETLPPLHELEAGLARDPENLELRLQIAERQVAEGRYEPALEHLIEVVRRDRGALRERARRAMLLAFSMAGDEDYVSRYRRALSGALY
jgi:putative thioredoxin